MIGLKWPITFVEILFKDGAKAKFAAPDIEIDPEKGEVTVTDGKGEQRVVQLSEMASIKIATKSMGGVQGFYS